MQFLNDHEILCNYLFCSICYQTYHFHIALLYVQVHMRIRQSRDDIVPRSRKDILVHSPDHTTQLHSLEIYQNDKLKYYLRLPNL